MVRTFFHLEEDPYVVPLNNLASKNDLESQGSRPDIELQWPCEVVLGELLPKEVRPLMDLRQTNSRPYPVTLIGWVLNWF